MAAETVGSSPTLVEWLPDKETVAVWNLLSAPLGLIGAALFGLVASRGQIPNGFRVDTVEMLFIAVLTLAVFIVHELVHGAVMKRFGASPQFGMMKIGGSALGSAFYATAPGHLFTRNQYLLVALAPTLLLSALGVVLCLTPLGVVAWLPFTFHFMGCVGDLAVARRTARESSRTMCEDLRDGVRFVRGA